jgi:UDP-glucose:glycoprotein glucosyltransferase
MVRYSLHDPWLLDRQLARPGRQGPFNQVKRNFWHVVLVMDMSKAFSLSTISQTAQQMIKRGIPFRVGLVPLISDSADDMSRSGIVSVSFAE